MSRYVNVDEETEELINSVREENFPELVNCYVKYLFDTKVQKPKKNKKITFGYIKKADDLIKLFTANEVNRDEGYDFILFLMKDIWDNIEETDRKRIVRHELRHILYDPESDKKPYKIREHDINDFREEIELNKDDPDWDLRVLNVMESLYNEE